MKHVATPWYRLRPVSKARWFWPGFGLELVGIAAPVAYVLIKAKHENVGSSFTLATVRLAWHSSVHSKTGLAVLIAGAVLVAVGGALVARPYVSNAFVWLLVVPLASAAAAVLLGVGALLVALFIALAYAGLDDFGGVGPGRKKKADERAAAGAPS